MSKVKLDGFKIIGISKRTINGHDTGAIDIPALWQKFMGQKIMEQIPNKVSEEIFAIYTDYEGDFTKPYTFILGCKVSSLDEIPEGMVSLEIALCHYEQITINGDLTQGVMVYQAWEKIWKMDINRSYQSDFEIYGAKTMNPNDAEVDIFVSV
ncbi:GyrI-like domain-containing protein [Portibacter lacus]|uniref:AraC family transcriptional regulator n=1 Tax=Portibacter lacus TaxID=1099794 RepID=A0AA37SL46_9BACT|nr:GyrI-like domain-containing protein [Portibacter lacus]GLR15559.1 AraC family transcriptional regulator [Portibacter lacus]